ncbi:hypothetical protein CRUP_020685 [Coryphaenoides rupestris]|nr:hypothetical protein CRUP_020685 [Coryphaenoides rupestris]
MREIFRSFPDVPGSGDGSPVGSPDSLRAVANLCGKPDEQIILLASRLSRHQQKQLAKLVRLLGMKQVETFSSSVSHVVVQDGTTPTTLPILQGVLAGCWVLRHSWVEACLQAGKWLPETEYEAGDGPRRGRVNKCNLLPPLFDGCFFFPLGSLVGSPSKPELLSLLQAGGGQLLRRQPKPDSDVTQTMSAAAYHAAPGSDQALCTQYILYDPRAKPPPPAALVRHRGKVWSAPIRWVVDCIAAFRLLPVPEA